MDADDEFGYGDNFTEEDLHQMDEIESAAYVGMLFL